MFDLSKYVRFAHRQENELRLFGMKASLYLEFADRDRDGDMEVRYTLDLPGETWDFSGEMEINPAILAQGGAPLWAAVIGAVTAAGGKIPGAFGDLIDSLTGK